MADLSKLVIPVKNTSTGVVTNQEFNLAGSGGGGSDTNYIGTKAAYDALPSSEKDKYDSMDFTDYEGATVDPTPMINSPNLVASGGVYDAIMLACGKKLAAQTLQAGDTTITFADASISSTSTILPFTSILNVMVLDIETSTGQAVLTFDPQETDMSVYIIVR
jgi:hypothetical protein